MSAGVGQFEVAILDVGSEFAGYRVEAVLDGQSGIGRVYEATRLESGDRVALKVFGPRAVGTPPLRDAFDRTLEAQAGISHPNIVSIEDWGTEPVPYMAMTLVLGTTFAELLAQGALPDLRALEILTAVAEGLDAGRREGLIYRRLQPSGILLNDEGGVWLGDFGAARGARGLDLISTGRRGRLVDYVSPEELKTGETTAASGVYSLGAIAFEALAGRPPFASKQDGATLRAHLEARPQGPGSVRPALPGRLDEAIVRALSKDPARRPGSAGELMQSVVSAYPGYLEALKPVPDGAPVRQGLRSRRFALAGLALAGLLGAAALGSVAAGGEESPQGPVAAKRIVTSDLIVHHPADWRASRRAPELAGLTLADPVALSSSAVPGRGGQFVAARRARGSLPPEGELVELGAVVARRYTGLSETGSTRRVVAYAVPSAAGQVVAACIGPTTGTFAARCRRVASTVRPRREGVALAAASPTYGLRVSGLVKRLDRIRVKGRRRLARARTPAGQRRLTARLSRDYGALARVLARIESPGPARASHRAALGQLRRAGRGFRDMSHAARARASGRWISGRNGVRSAEGNFQGALRSLRGQGYQVR